MYYGRYGTHSSNTRYYIQYVYTREEQYDYSVEENMNAKGKIFYTSL